MVDKAVEIAQRNGKAVSLEVGGPVDVETGKNIFQRCTRRKGGGIDQVIICRVNGKARRLQAVVRLKAQVPRKGSLP